uniref:Uncharacterized protein n=1 Tax=Schistocephalus solidus TaxID=70667 RepID=A0A0X3PRF5_SCHSO
MELWVCTLSAVLNTALLTNQVLLRYGLWVLVGATLSRLHCGGNWHFGAFCTITIFPVLLRHSARPDFCQQVRSINLSGWPLWKESNSAYAGMTNLVPQLGP